jgi:predicted MFS family arabinose efflux permease
MLPSITDPGTRRDFHRLWLGTMFNSYSMWAEQVIVGSTLFRLTESSAWVGIAFALFFLPYVIFGLVSGGLSDWMDRRRLLTVTSSLLLALYALIALVAVTVELQPWLLLTATFFSGCLRAVNQPARLAYAYDLVGESMHTRALGAINVSTRVGQLIGALSAGLVLQRLGIAMAYTSLALMHIVASLAFARLSLAGRAAPTERPELLVGIGELVTELRHNRTLLALLAITGCVEVFGFSFATVLPELATARLGGGPELLGVMHGIRGTGGLVAGIALASLTIVRGRGTIFLLAIACFGLSLASLGQSSGLAFSLLALFIIAMAACASDVLTQSMMQTSVSNEMRGRAMGTWVIALGMAPIGHLAIGTLAASIGAAGAVTVSGAALLAVALLGLVFASRLRAI